MADVKVVPLKLETTSEPTATLRSWGFVQEVRESTPSDSEDRKESMRSALLGAWQNMDKKLKANGY
jgi:hypothetical protein